MTELTEPTNEPQKPVFVEIRVDGATVHSFLASQLVTNEDREKLTLEAQRWGPNIIDQGPNPLLDVQPPEALLGHGMLVSSADDGIAAGAGEFLASPDQRMPFYIGGQQVGTVDLRELQNDPNWIRLHTDEGNTDR